MNKVLVPSVETLPNPDAAPDCEAEESLRRSRPTTKEGLRNYVKAFLDVAVPDRRICPGHSSPMDYLWHSFSGEGGSTGSSPIRNADAVVWANRAGGKTELAAVATLLDARLQAQLPDSHPRRLRRAVERMYEYLRGFLQQGFESFLAGPVLKGKCRFANGSAVEVLTQSATSVRGSTSRSCGATRSSCSMRTSSRPPSSRRRAPTQIVAAMELISTMHRPYGIMQREVAAATSSGVPVFKWCLWETIEKCTGRNCSQCPLSGDCQGRAKSAGGYLKIDDCITQMRRSSRAGWESEMLCIRPSLDNVVFGEFDPAVHVRPVDYDPNLPLYRTLDFGFVNPFVCLWIQVDPDGVVRVIDEYVRSRATIDVHAERDQGPHALSRGAGRGHVLRPGRRRPQRRHRHQRRPRAAEPRHRHEVPPQHDPRRHRADPPGHPLRRRQKLAGHLPAARA